MRRAREQAMLTFDLVFRRSESRSGEGSCKDAVDPAGPLRSMGVKGGGNGGSHGYARYTGAGEGIRTLDPNLGKVVLYP
jgi:hypothetical protein